MSAEKKFKLIHSSGNNSSKVAHTLTLQLPAAPCARPVCIDEDKNRPIPPDESGASCSQYSQQIKYDEWKDRNIVAFIDFASPNMPVNKLRLYIDDKDVETDEHYDVKESCTYKVQKFCIWLFILAIGIAIIAITSALDKSSEFVGPTLFVFIIVIVAIASWLWNCWMCGKCGKGQVEVKVDEFVGYKKEKSNKQADANV